MPPINKPGRRSRPAPSARHPAWWIPLALVVVTVAAYAQVASFDFVNFDDQVYVTNNAHVRAGLTWAGIAWAFSASYAANWHPLTWMSHMADVTSFGLNAGLHHVTNLALHTLNVLLLWLALRRLTGSVFRSALVAALFAVHPLHVESVAWVAERKDVLSTFFAMLTLWTWAGYVQRPTAVRYAGALVWFTLGLLSKPMLVTLPFVLLLLDVWPLARQRPFGALVLEKLPFVALAMGSSAVTFVVQQHGGAVASLDAMPFGVRLANALGAYLAYIGQTIWPVNLAAWYPYAYSPATTTTLLASAVLLGVTIGALLMARARPYLIVGWLWFVGMLVPVIGLVQIGAQARADRYTYLPLIGLFLAGVWGMADLARGWALPRRVVATAAVIVVIACAAVTRIQAGYWKDGIALWQRAVAVTTANGRAHTNLGTSLDAAGRHAEAIAEYHAALEVEPHLPQAHYNLGLSLVAAGKLDDGIREFRDAVRVMPDHAQAHDSLANALVDQHQLDEAIAEYQVAIRLQPGNAQFHNNLGAAFADSGRMTEATKEFLEAVRIEPDRAEWHYAVGMAYAAQGDNARAISYLREAVRIDPRHDRARRLLAELGGS